MNHAVKLFAILLIVITTVCGQSTPNIVKINETAKSTGTLKLTYVGNEGVLISDGEKSVLIDGLHREYGPEYLFPPPDLLNAMETAQPPFNSVRVVLVSHVHRDHFHAESVGLHVKNNPKATLVSSSQIMVEVGRGYRDHEMMASRTREITPEWKEKKAVEIEGIKVTLLGLKHGGGGFWWVKNLGHIIEIGGKKLFHFGDADMTVENFASFDLPREKIDIAFIPYWFLLSEAGRKIVREQIGSKANIAVHIPPAAAEKEAANLRTLFPGIEAFTVIKQEFQY